MNTPRYDLHQMAEALSVKSIARYESNYRDDDGWHEGRGSYHTYEVVLMHRGWVLRLTNEYEQEYEAENQMRLWRAALDSGILPDRIEQEVSLIDYDYTEGMTLVYSGEGGYGRTALAWIRISRCDSCGRGTAVLTTDASDGEYASIALCKACINEGFIRFERGDFSEVTEEE